MKAGSLGLLILAILLAQFWPLSLASGSCRIGLREQIPQNLPWYFVAVFGDNRPHSVNELHYPSTYIRLVRDLNAIRPFAVIGTGDHTGMGSRRQIDVFMESLRNTSNVWVIEGNHDIGGSSDLAYWHQRVAPPMYYVDEIPGWRLVFFSTELSWDKYSAMRSFLAEALNTSRATILVFHRPLYPDLNYNMDPRMAELVWREIERHPPRLVLQGHWHGYVEARRNHTLFVVTAGAGAPLYQPGAKHHYLVIRLYPHGSFEITRISLDEGALNVSKSLHGRIVVSNKLVDLRGKPIAVPVRIKTEVSGIDVHAVIMARPGETRIYYSSEEGIVSFTLSSPTEWFIYVPVANRALVNYTASGARLTLNVSSVYKQVVRETCYATITATRFVARTYRLTTTITKTTSIEKTFILTTTVSETSVQTIRANSTCTSTCKREMSEYQLALFALVLILAGAALVAARRRTMS